MQSEAPCFCMKDTGTDAGLFWSVHVIHPPGIVPTQKAAPPGGGAPWRGGLREARRMMEARRTQALMQACFGVKFRDYCTMYLELQSIQRSEICSPPSDSSHSKGSSTPWRGAPVRGGLRVMVDLGPQRTGFLRYSRHSALETPSPIKVHVLYIHFINCRCCSLEFVFEWSVFLTQAYSWSSRLVFT